MPIEIERKFLVTCDAWRAQAERAVIMRQGYLNTANAMDAGAISASVRVRIEGDHAHLNLKSREIGRSRQEFDYPIPLADAQALLLLALGASVDKRRHFVRYGAHLWEVDEFLGDSAGLVVAEIELIDADEVFERPPWIGREVTLVSRYYNLAIASRPYAQWSKAERDAQDVPGDNAC